MADPQLAEPAHAERAHIELRGVSKRFGSTQAVDCADIVIRRGCIHGLVGENGAGKSTVGKVIAGVHTADSGTVVVDGRPCRFRSPRQAFSAGITTIAQELALVPDRSVVDNVFLGVESTRWGFVDRGDTLRRFEALIERSGISIDGDASVRQLSVAEQQRVEILRATARRSELIIMDEPSARLSVEERDQLHRLVRSLRDQNITVLFISHFLDEILDLADDITVMRDGRVVKNTEPSSETAGSLVEAMIGRKLEGNFPPKPPAPNPDQRSALTVRGLRPAGLTGSRPVGRAAPPAEAPSSAGLDLDVLPGEIVGIAGLVGSGRTEFVRSIYGADSAITGEVRVRGRDLGRLHPRRAIRSGMGLIPESRKEQGLMMDRSLRENVSLPHLRGVTRAGLVMRRAESDLVAETTANARVRGGGLDTPVRLLSGGNQQKCLFARWMSPGLRVLIADEPTRGVDIGSKRSIYDLISAAARDGLAVLIVSSELEELVGLCHRVIVMREGRFATEFSHPQLDEAQILRYAFGEEAAARRAS
ncbi:MAG: sugar ABC transporter ATP-binding protein [Acidimicrobiaceae bacterium]|nr:sugar ABC transporter ATP-binding protein [Acidimicrobiaceae bacterium]MXZ95986.1 sugar ABC transporter ATP-binding protein [Acidimicrobiaceae bacterium]MYF43976.1 sugar ABC transporter ATP-binding protein [Acidimicrobiaceae bacterium]